MIALLLWLLAAFGFAFVVGHSKISLPVREKLGDGWVTSLLECPGCLGFWQGLAVGGFAPSFMLALAPQLDEIGAFVLWPRAACGVVLALATSASNLLLAKKVGMV